MIRSSSSSSRWYLAGIQGCLLIGACAGILAVAETAQAGCGRYVQFKSDDPQAEDHFRSDDLADAMGQDAPTLPPRCSGPACRAPLPLSPMPVPTTRSSSSQDDWAWSRCESAADNGRFGHAAPVDSTTHPISTHVRIDRPPQS